MTLEFRPEFTEWLDDQRRRHDPVGDLARDVGSDPTWPEACESRSALHGYLDERRACEGAHRALDAAWDEWGARES